MRGGLTTSAQPGRSAAQYGARGFTLIEVLVTVVILSVGLLGVVALQAEGLKSGRTAILRNKAVALSADMADRMRANRVGAIAGEHITPATDSGTNRNCADDLTGGPTVTCTPAFMADHDIWLWKQVLTDARLGLPGSPTGVITSDNAAEPTFTITVTWTEPSGTYNYALGVQP